MPGPPRAGVDRDGHHPAHLSDVVAFDAPLLGRVSGLRVAHLQCHIGTDSVSLARLHAEVTGLDLSAPAIEVARDLARRSGTSATFAVGDVHDAPAVIGAGFDVVHTSVGVLNRLPDLRPWALAAAGVLREGGRSYVRDAHPALWAWDDMGGVPALTHPHVTPRGAPLTTDERSTCAGGDAGGIVHTRRHEWNHPSAEVVTAVAGAGMRIDRLAEHDGPEWPMLASMRREGAQFFLPEPLRGKVPAMFSLWATKS